MGRRFVFRMLDGSEWTSDIGAAQTLPDQIAFERQFKRSAGVMAATATRAQQYMAEVEAAVREGREPPDQPDDVLPRVEWLAFFAWRDLRRHHPEVIAAKFDDFVEQVEDMDYQEDEEDEDDAPDNVVLLEGSGLDPSVPAPLPTPPPSFSSPASATGTSS
jgi:hypothetical protein